MITDLAQKIFSTEEVAARYALTMAQLRALVARPPVFAQIKRQKALWASDGNVEARTRTLYLMGVEHAAPEVINNISDAKLSPAQRAEFLKLAMRVAGVDGLPSQQATGGPTIAPVQISINFSGGRSEKFTTVVEPPIIEGVAA